MNVLEAGGSARYHLSPTLEGIEIAVHKDVAPSKHKFREDDLQKMAVHLKIDKEFILPSDDREWGYGPVLSLVDSTHPEWLVYQAKYPKLFTKNPIAQLATSQTLAVLFHQLQFEEADIESTDKQLMAIGMDTVSHHMFFSVINANIYPSLQRWLGENYTDESVEAVERQMKKTFDRMWNHKTKPYFGNHEFRAEWDTPKRLSLEIPGNACDLSPEYYSSKDPAREYRLTPHNVDGPTQQLTLLTGLAKIEEMASGRPYILDK